MVCVCLCACVCVWMCLWFNASVCSVLDVLCDVVWCVSVCCRCLCVGVLIVFGCFVWCVM